MWLANGNKMINKDRTRLHRLLLRIGVDPIERLKQTLGDGEETEPPSNNHSATPEWLDPVTPLYLSKQAAAHIDMDHDSTVFSVGRRRRFVRDATCRPAMAKQFLRRHHHLMAVAAAHMPCHRSSGSEVEETSWP